VDADDSTFSKKSRKDEPLSTGRDRDRDRDGAGSSSGWGDVQGWGRPASSRSSVDADDSTFSKKSRKDEPPSTSRDRDRDSGAAKDKAVSALNNGIGRGSARTLPAWMTESSSQSQSALAHHVSEAVVKVSVSEVSGHQYNGNNGVKNKSANGETVSSDRDGSAKDKAVSALNNGIGRGSARTLPAWMTESTSQSPITHDVRVGVDDASVSQLSAHHNTYGINEVNYISSTTSPRLGGMRKTEISLGNKVIIDLIQKKQEHDVVNATADIDKTRNVSSLTAFEVNSVSNGSESSSSSNTMKYSIITSGSKMSNKNIDKDKKSAMKSKDNIDNQSELLADLKGTSFQKIVKPTPTLSKGAMMLLQQRKESNTPKSLPEPKLISPTISSDTEFKTNQNSNTISQSDATSSIKSTSTPSEELILSSNITSEISVDLKTLEENNNSNRNIVITSTTQISKTQLTPPDNKSSESLCDLQEESSTASGLFQDISTSITVDAKPTNANQNEVNVAVDSDDEDLLW
jgi:hypothetical protein